MADHPGWTVEFYRDARGRSPAREFLPQLPKPERADMLRAIDLLQEFGLALRLPHARPVERGLWELRAGAGRLFYVAHAARRFIVLHGYRKKGRKAPRNEIELALKRWSDFLERER